MCKTSHVVTSSSSKTKKKEKKPELDVKKERISEKSKTIKKPKKNKKIKKKRNLSILKTLKQAEEENDMLSDEESDEESDAEEKKPKTVKSEPKFNPFCHVESLFKTEYKPTIEKTPLIYKDGCNKTVAPEIEKLFKDQILKNKRQRKIKTTRDFIERWYCRRCMRYSCTIHANYPYKKNEIKEWTPKRLENYRCGGKCYKHILEAEKKGKVLKEAKCRPFARQHEKLFKTLVEKDCSNNFCQITKTMACVTRDSSRTCQEIYRMGKKYIVEMPEVPRKKVKVYRPKSGYGYNKPISNDKVARPCDHLGPCTAAKGCWCVKNTTLCTKYCSCPPSCRYQFPGCKCEPGQCRTEECLCVLLKWECDPDVCKNCNAIGEMVRLQYEGPNPNLREEKGKCCDVKNNEEKFEKPICGNYNLQRGISKHLTVGVSTVAGYGCFAGEDIKAGDYIGEYTGEIIDRAEAERRGKVYDALKCSYLFTLNKTQIVDATIYGNFTRFINHSARDPNVGPKIMTADNEQRIAFFANHDIKKGEELFFDYRYGEEQAELYVPLEIEEIDGKKKAVASVQEKKTRTSKKRKR